MTMARGTEETADLNEHGERMTHTPGPWHVDSGTCISAGDLRLTRTLEAYTEMFDPKRFWETRANARLMAAAPEMLAALKLAYPLLTDKAAREEIGALLYKISASPATGERA